jgi:catechol 2,3-dioxygenase-like lactoylglutathione lyase family enzyme
MSMQLEASTLKQSAAVLVVSQMDASLAYYREALGFSVEFQSGAPAFYACLYRDGISLHLIAANQTRLLPGHGAVCIFVSDVDEAYTQASLKGAHILRPPVDHYGMRDFDALDLDGNQLTFGMSNEKATPVQFS